MTSGSSSVKVSEKQLKIAQDGDLDPLIKLLRHEDEYVKTRAKRAISNLSRAGKDGVAVAKDNGFTPLIELVKMEDDEVRSKAVWAMAILASNDENQFEIVHQVGWSCIMDLIKDEVVEVQCGAITLLGNLALSEESKEQIIQKNGVEVLMTLLKETRDIIVKRAIVTALSNIVDADNAIEVFDDENLNFLLVLLAKSEDERLLSGVVHTISNIANADDVKFNRHIVRKSLGRLIDLLDSPADVVLKGAIMALNGLTSSASHQEEIIKQGGAKKLMSLLKEDNTDDELLLGIVLCINNLAQNISNRGALADLGISKILSNLADDTSDSNIRSECTEAVRAIDDGVLSDRKRRRTRRHSYGIKDSSNSGPTNGGILENVRKIIQVLISDARNQDRLRNSGVIPHLITLIPSEQQNEELKGLALDALTMLSINNLNNQNEIAMSEQCRCLIVLEEVVQNNLSPPKILVRAVRLIGALCWKNKMIQGLVSERKIILYLVGMLDTYDNNLKKAVLTSLACTAEDNDANKHRIARLGADKLIAKIIVKEKQPTPLVAAAAQAIAALCKENPSTQAVCKFAVAHIVSLLDTAVRVTHGMSAIEDHIVQEQLCAALHELARNNKPNKSIMWKDGVKKLMTKLLYDTSASPYCHYNALALLWECAKSIKKRQLLASNLDLKNAIRPLAESKDSSVRDAANRLNDRLK